MKYILKWLFGLGLVEFCTFNLGGVASVVGIASGVSNILGGGGGGGGSSGAGNVAGGAIYDPFADYRKPYANKLTDLVNNPASITSAPFYQFGFGQGLEALRRSQASTGLTGSGAQGIQLQNYGQNFANTAYQNLFANYSALSGATQGLSNVTTQNALNSQNQQAGWSAIGQGVGALGSIYNNYSSNPYNALPSYSGGYSGGSTSTSDVASSYSI
jgi:hypothetical protein